MTDLRSVPSRSSNIVTRKTGSEYVLVPIANNIADMNSVFTLNETGAFIWELIDSKRNVEEIIGLVTQEFEVDRDSAAEDVFSLLENMSNYLIIST